MKSRNLFIMCLIIGVSFSLFAEENADKEDLFKRLESIYQIADDVNRLASYDQLAESLGIVRDVSEEVTESAWRVSVDVDPMDDSKKIIFILLADNPDMYDRQGLVIRYQNGRTELYINWSDYLADNNKMTVRFEKEDPYTVVWHKSSDNTALFCPNPEAFIQKILSNDTLVMRVTPYNSGPKTAVFNITGLMEEAEPYNIDLHWF